MGRKPSAQALLLTYPRSRPELPQKQRASYIEHYRFNRSGACGLPRVVLKLESWMHRRVGDNLNVGRLLEIGAGTLNHVPYLPPTCECDVVEPFHELWQDSPFRSRISHMFADLGEIPAGARYDCIFSVAVLEHLSDLPLILARAALLLSMGGTFRAGFPSEGGFLWGISWRVTTGIEYRLHRGADYGAIMRHEHLNTADEILSLLNYFYEEVEVTRFPLPFKHMCFYVAVVATRPKLDRCHNLIASRFPVEVPAKP